MVVKEKELRNIYRDTEINIASFNYEQKNYNKIENLVFFFSKDFAESVLVQRGRGPGIFFKV